jgi:hypothetical protein
MTTETAYRNGVAGASAQAEFDIDFDDELPRWEFFPVYWLAKRWHATSQHVFNLIESGELEVGVDLRNKASSRTMIRVPRKSVVRFLNKRKNLQAVAAANPSPKPRVKPEKR